MNRHNGKWVVGFIFILVFIFFFIPPAYTHTKDTKSVLVLNSYHKGFPWTDNIVSGIESVLKPEKSGIKLVVEYMDTKTMGDGAKYTQVLYELYKYKYKNHHFDLIISSDDNAFNFLRENNKELFPGVPVVFCGVNNLDAPNIIDPKEFTGVLETTSHEGTIDLILDLHPKTKKIILIIDKTPSGEYRWRVTKPSFSHYKNIEFIRFSNDYLISEIEDKVRNLTEETAVIFFTLYRDKSGKYLSLNDSVARISKASIRPVYTTHLLELPYGVVGGKVLGGFYHGETVAHIAERILDGEEISNIPVVETSPTQYVFDYTQLKRWGIKLSDLPDGSTILNKPFSVYEKYKLLIWSVLLAVIILVAIVFTLLLNITKRKRAEEALRENEEKYRTLFESESDSIFIYDPTTMKILDANPATSTIYGYNKNELIGMSCLRLSAEPEKSESTVNVVRANGKLNIPDRLHQKKDGIKFPVDITVYSVRISGKDFMFAVSKDMTIRRNAEQQIEESLKEKETLLQEIHHRVKNNMQVINSLLKLQSNSIEDEQAKNILKDSQSRVYAMAAVHETLHGSENLSAVDLKSYLSKVTASIFQTYSTNKQKVELSSNVENSPININQAYPLGLIINELISNSLKYAFPDDRKGEITVNLKKLDKEFELTISDDGVGMPKGLDWKNSKSLGLKLVRTLVENQLNGSVDMESNNGTKFTIKFNIA